MMFVTMINQLGFVVVYIVFVYVAAKCCLLALSSCDPVSIFRSACFWYTNFNDGPLVSATNLPRNPPVLYALPAPSALFPVRWQHYRRQSSLVGWRTIFLSPTSAIVFDRSYNDGMQIYANCTCQFFSPR